jgi:hypothetical protein
MSENKKDSIEIPEPINRPKEEEKVKADHPNPPQGNKIGKPVRDNKTSKSRFEPDPIPVEIPSKGYPYKGVSNDKDLVRGIVYLKPMTYKEEKILTTDRLVREGIALDMILESCIKSDINPYDLLSTDRMYLLFYLRGMSYGLKYDFDVKCYHCGTNFVQSVEIDKLPINEFESEEEAEEPFSIKLPISQAELKVHFMRGNEERKATEDATAKSYDEPDDVGATLLNTVEQVKLKDGEVLSPSDKIDFLNNLVGADIDHFRTVVNELSPGIKQLEHIYCPRCRGELEFNVPLGRNFFRRSR